MNNYILNTIAFADDLKKGVSQKDLIGRVKKIGFDDVEIRNEFLQDGELKQIREQALKYDISIYYSVNDVLIKNGKLNQRTFQYIKEMRDLGSSHLKMNVGDVEKFSGDFDASFLALLDSSFELNVENNQTVAESKLENIINFFEIINKNKVNIGFCFDTANWFWTGDDPITAANQLKNVTKYVHLKNVSSNGQNEVVTLDKGRIDWKKIVSLFNANEYGFEYSATDSELRTDLTSVKSYLTGK